jgi:two-component system sensor histidine kinase KdpD
VARLVGQSLSRFALRRQVAQAEVAVETEHMKAKILSSVSHDLRTPLAVIVGSAETLGTESVSQDASVVRDLARNIGNEAERLERLVTNLLSLTRLKSGTLDLKRDLIPLEEILAPVLARVEARSSSSPLHISMNIPDSLPLIDGDPVLLEQLFENLLDNARKYAPEEVSLRATRSRKPGSISIAVEDRGPGVPEPRRADLFEALGRAVSGNGGLGMGLSICRGIARAHGGDVTFEDREGGGSVFHVSLPAREVTMDEFRGAPHVTERLEDEPLFKGAEKGIAR